MQNQRSLIARTQDDLSRTCEYSFIRTMSDLFKHLQIMLLLDFRRGLHHLRPHDLPTSVKRGRVFHYTDIPRPIKIH